MIINLISGPRNISTALMYSFAQRDDMQVIDEPYYAHYLHQTGVDHPGRQEILDTMSIDQKKVEADILERSSRGHVFLKNMGHHCIGLDWSFFERCTNFFLVREPRQMIASISKILPNPTLRDIGLAMQAEVAQWLTGRGEKIVVLDSNSVLPDPKRKLEILCRHLGIQFEEAMLNWEAGPIPEDGRWAKYWYANVHKSTGFQSSFSKNPFPDHLTGLLEDAMPHYQFLKQFEI